MDMSHSWTSMPVTGLVPAERVDVPPTSWCATAAARCQGRRDLPRDETGVVIQDSGHWIYEEHPAELTQILLQFLR
jgi:pimeloyl-ACP methyl ester carboxylesterase